MAFAPIFRPTEQEFRDFAKFVQGIEPVLAKVGICKVVAPLSWRNQIHLENLDDLRITKPVQQLVTGAQGIYRVMQIEKRAMTVGAFRSLANKQKLVEEDAPYDIIERKYWKTIASISPMYGADMSGSLMKEQVQEWNLNHLDNLLTKVDVVVPGVNQPYLYFGMWKAMFPWHTEDLDLYSINYLHFGRPKAWFCIAPEHRERFERIAQGFFPEDHKECAQFLRHKMYILSPSVLQKYNMPFTRVLQEEGEFVLTYPGAYHSGFNHGFNCAESVNFAFDSWIRIGEKAKICKCVPDSVRLNMSMFLGPVDPKVEVLSAAALETDQPTAHETAPSVCGHPVDEVHPVKTELPEDCQEAKADRNQSEFVGSSIKSPIGSGASSDSSLRTDP